MSLDVEAGDDSGSLDAPRARDAFRSTRSAIEYTPQGGDGMPQGSTTFEDEWGRG